MFGRRWQQQFGGNQSLKDWLDETPICSLLALLAAGLFVASYIHGGKGGPVRWGIGDWDAYWRGEVWRLLVRHLHHGDPLHLLFNLYWLMRLGRPLEIVAGTARMALFVLAAAVFVGLACTLTIEANFIGLSGIGYAIFGVLWVLRRQVPAFRAALDDVTVKLMVAWLFICVLLTVTGAYAVANVGHFSGLVFGMAVGWVARRWRHLGWLARAALLLPSLLLPAGLCYLVRPQWDAGWHAWRALNSRDPAFQVREYRRALALRPGFHELRLPLAAAYANLKDRGAARRGLEELLAAGEADAFIIEAYLFLLSQEGDFAAMPPWIARLELLDPDRARDWGVLLRARAPGLKAPGSGPRERQPAKPAPSGASPSSTSSTPSASPGAERGDRTLSPARAAAASPGKRRGRRWRPS